MSTMTDTKATAQQFADVRKLISDLEKLGATAQAEQVRSTGNQLRAAGEFTFKAAETLVDTAVFLRTEAEKVAQAVSRKAQRDLPSVPAGGYAVDNENGELRFYEVEISRSGWMDVYVRHSDERSKLLPKAMVGVLRKIVEKGLVEASKDYGRKMGVCGRCGRSLTDEASRAAGIGPICAGKLGG